jgi:hypothetical protein
LPFQVRMTRWMKNRRVMVKKKRCEVTVCHKSTCYSTLRPALKLPCPTIVTYTGYQCCRAQSRAIKHRLRVALHSDKWRSFGSPIAHFAHATQQRLSAGRCTNISCHISLPEFVEAHFSNKRRTTEYAGYARPVCWWHGLLS